MSEKLVNIFQNGRPVYCLESDNFKVFLSIPGEVRKIKETYNKIVKNLILSEIKKQLHKVVDPNVDKNPVKQK